MEYPCGQIAAAGLGTQHNTNAQCPAAIGEKDYYFCTDQIRKLSLGLCEIYGFRK